MRLFKVAFLFTLLSSVMAAAQACDAEALAVNQARQDVKTFSVATNAVNFRAHDFGAQAGVATVAVVYAFDMAVSNEGFPSNSGEMVAIYTIDFAGCKILRNGTRYGKLQNHAL